MQRILQIIVGLSLLVGLVIAAIMTHLADVLCGLIAGALLRVPLVLGVPAGSLVYGWLGTRQTMGCVAVVAALEAFELFRFYVGSAADALSFPR